MAEGKPRNAAETLTAGPSAPATAQITPRLACPVDPAMFLGAWAFERRIDDRRAGLAGRVTGEAAFSADPTAGERLDYAEEGWLDYGGRVVQAAQRYRWVFLAADRVEIRNRDGATLCALSPEIASPEIAAAAPDAPVWAHHLCGEDHYETRLLLDNGCWRQLWRVRGPRKDYLSETVYRRA